MLGKRNITIKVLRYWVDIKKNNGDLKHIALSRNKIDKDCCQIIIMDFRKKIM